VKRYTEEHAKQIAKDFAGTELAGAWDLFGQEIRRAIIDSVVMDTIRVADTVDSTMQLTAAEIMAFRGMVESKLADGARGRRRYVVSDYEQGATDATQAKEQS